MGQEHLEGQQGPVLTTSSGELSKVGSEVSRSAEVVRRRGQTASGSGVKVPQSALQDKGVLLHVERAGHSDGSGAGAGRRG